MIYWLTDFSLYEVEYIWKMCMQSTVEGSRCQIHSFCIYQQLWGAGNALQKEHVCLTTGPSLHLHITHLDCEALKMHKMPDLTKVQFRHTLIPCSDGTWIKHRNAARLAKDILGSLPKVEGVFFKCFLWPLYRKKQI